MPLIRKPADRPGAARQAAGDVAAALLRGSSEERWEAARAMADTPAGLSALAAALARETDPRVREAIFTGLVRIATPASARTVLTYLRSDDASTRIAALDALRAMPEATRPHLPALLHDPDADVRLLGCEILRDLPSEATPLLCALLETEEVSNVCAAAVDVLAEIGTAEALATLMRCAARFNEDPFLGFAIKVAAERLRATSPEARE